jgi:hypothetical protein
VFACTAGDFLERAAAQRTIRDAEEKAKFMFQALGLMDYDAVNVGEKDLAYGPRYLKAQAEEHGVPLISANAVHRDTGELFFDPYVIREQKGAKVAFIGVTSPERHVIAQAESYLLDHKIKLLDPSEQTLKFLPELREQADLVVLLSHAGIETSEFLAQDLPVDVVVVGHYPAIENNPKEFGETVLVMAGSKSDRFGTLDVTLAADGSGVWQVDGDAIRLLSKGPSDPEIAMIETAWDQWDKDKRRERQLASQRAREAKQREEQTTQIHSRGGVFGAESCKSCHAPVYESWMSTPHATAFATLAEADAWDNPDCLGCHVTGIEDKHYVEDVNLPPEIWNVQCEECHGSGLNHARDGSYLTAGEATCRKCHDADNSPEFDFAVYSSYGVH